MTDKPRTDDGGFLINGIHPDDMFGVHLMERPDDGKADDTIVATLRKEAGHADVEWEDGAGDFFRQAADRIEALVARVQELERTIDTFWQYVETAYDIEPRAYFEKEAPTNGFGSPLAQAAHHIWKRNPKVEKLEREVARLKAELGEPVAGHFRDDGTQGEDLSGIPNGFREHVERVARGEADIESLLPNWKYIRQTGNSR